MTEDNPYASPSTGEKRGKLSAGRIAVIVVLILLTAPSALIAFYATCFAVSIASYAGLNAAGVQSEGPLLFAIGLAILSGIVAAGAVIYAIIRAIQKVGTRPIVEAEPLVTETPHHER